MPKSFQGTRSGGLNHVPGLRMITVIRTMGNDINSS